MTFYEINDVILNKKKIRKFIPEYKKVKRDRGHTREEIHKLLDIADERMRLVIYILARKANLGRNRKRIKKKILI